MVDVLGGRGELGRNGSCWGLVLEPVSRGFALSSGHVDGILTLMVFSQHSILLALQARVFPLAFPAADRRLDIPLQYPSCTNVPRTRARHRCVPFEPEESTQWCTLECVELGVGKGQECAGRE